MTLRTRILSVRKRATDIGLEKTRVNILWSFYHFLTMLGPQKFLTVIISLLYLVFLLLCILILGLETWDNLVVISIRSIQTMVLQYQFSLQEIRAAWRNGWLQVWGRKCSKTSQENLVIPDSKGTIKNYWGSAKRNWEAICRAFHWLVMINGASIRVTAMDWKMLSTFKSVSS